jgi:hypothetical protein
MPTSAAVARSTTARRLARDRHAVALGITDPQALAHSEERPRHLTESKARAVVVIAGTRIDIVLSRGR